MVEFKRYYQNRQYEEALAISKNFIKLDPNKLEFHMLIAMINAEISAIIKLMLFLAFKVLSVMGLSTELSLPLIAK